MTRTGRPATIEIGKVYGGVKVLEVIPGENLITVQCMKCGQEVKKYRSNVTSKKTKGCGFFSCREKSKWWKQGVSK